MSSLSLVTNERMLINILIRKPDNILRLDRNYFISTIGKDLFEGIKKTYLSGLELNIDNMIIYSNQINQGITKELLTDLISIETNLDNFEKYYKKQRQEFAKDRLENKLLKDTLIQVSSKGEIDLEKIESLKNEITEMMELVEGKESYLISLKQLMEHYKSILIKRKKGEEKYSTGDSYLDSKLTMGYAPNQMTVIFGGTSEGKSIFELNCISKRINKQIPSLYISLENDEILTMDRLISIRTGIPYTDFYFKEGQENEELFRIFEEERRRLENNKYFFMVEKTDLSLNDIELLITEAKRKMGVDYLVCTIDLLTMIKEFSNEISASNIEQAINETHRIARRTNCHFVNVVQANDENDYHPKTIKDVIKCRPMLRNIKNSKEIGKRARLVLSIFRPKMYAQKFFGDDHPEVEIMDDLILVRCEKQSQGKNGMTLKYLYEGETFRLFKYVEENKDDS